MNIITAFIAYSQSTKLVQPSKCSFDDPAKHTKATAVFSSSLGQNRINPQAMQCVSMRLAIIGAVTLHTIRPLTRTTDFACNGWNRLNQWQKLSHIMTVGSGYFRCERNAIGIGDNVMFRPQFPSIRCIRARFRPPKTARTEAESTTAREKSIWSAWRSLFKRTWWILSQMPFSFQLCRRRQQVIPLPQPISLGRYSQGIPVFSTKRIPVNTLRLLTGGRPPLGFNAGFGSNGSMNFHSSSLRSGLAIALSSLTMLNILYLLFLIHRLYHYQKLRFC